jgi:exodeoxyribonuclease VII large subunit
LQAAGRGDLALAFEQLKERLLAEGLFDPAHKQPIPAMPAKIGIVTSADAAALRDILNVLSRRWPLVQVLVAPTLVQGRDAPPQIVNALTWLDGRNDIDTIIIARGGGSMEDLWAFNDERVARAIYQARHPVISGVGHETDFTIADFVADLRAPTPSAAAELAVPDQLEMAVYLAGLRATQDGHLRTLLAQYSQRVQAATRSLRHLGPQNRIDNNRQRLDVLAGRLDLALDRRRDRWANRLALAEARLQAISPLATLARGYAIVRHWDGRIVRRTADVAAGDRLQVQLTDGIIDVTAAAEQ